MVHQVHLGLAERIAVSYTHLDVYKRQEYELIDYDTSGDLVNFAGEQAFTRALVGLFTEDTKGIYFSTGHGERALTGDYVQAKTF